MTIDINNPYFRTKVLTATPEQLKLLLIEGSLRFMSGGREALLNENWEDVYSQLSQAKDILLELISGLRPELNPELCGRLSSLYTWMIVTLTEGSFQKDVTKIDDVIRIMEYERETWILLMEKLAADSDAESATVDASRAGQSNPAANDRKAMPAAEANRKSISLSA